MKQNKKIKNKLFLKKIASWLLLFFVVLLFSVYIYQNIESFRLLFEKAFSLGNISYMCLLFFLSLTVILINGLTIKVLIDVFGIKLNFKEWFGLSATTSFYNYIFPFHGGMIARAIYLKKRKNFSYTAFLSTLMASYLIIFLVSSFLGILAMIYLKIAVEIFSPLIFFIFLGVFILSFVLIVLPLKKINLKTSISDKINKIILGCEIIKKRKDIILKMALISFSQIFLWTLSIIICSVIFQTKIHFVKAVLLASIFSLEILVSLTPGNIGIGEAINIFSATLLGINLNEAIAIMIFWRMAITFTVFIVGPIFTYVVLKK